MHPQQQLRLRWQAAPDAEVADRLAAVHLRQAQRQSSGTTHPVLVYVTLGVVALALTLLAWPFGLLMPIFVGTILVLAKVVGPRKVAATFRNQPTAYDPYEVTIDGEGVHMVSPTVATHLRWSVFETAAVDDDVLVLKRRGVAFFQMVPLTTLDPQVDRDALVAEVRRLVDAATPG